MNDKDIEIQLNVALDQLKRVREDIRRLDEKISNGYVTKTELRDFDRRLLSLEDNQKWVVRAFAGSIIAGIMAAVYFIAGVQ